MSRFAHAPSSSSTSSNALCGTYDFDLVDASTFASFFWPALDQRLTKGLDRSIAWSEILVVIKGSAAVATSSKPYLAEKEYIELSERATPSFVGRREVYALFRAYEVMKNEAGMYDPADRCEILPWYLNTPIRAHSALFSGRTASLRHFGTREALAAAHLGESLTFPSMKRRCVSRPFTSSPHFN